jgi:FkbM family methyltransferase
MQRTPSRFAQLTFNAASRLRRLTAHSNLIVRATGRLFHKVASTRLIAVAGKNHTVDGFLYGRSMRMPAEHPLPEVLHLFPQYNRPLAMAIKAIALTSSGNPDLTVIDVGANIGETVAVIEQLVPDVTYLCIEADEDIARICRFNHRGNPRVQTEQCYIGENAGSPVMLQDDGRANPTTKLIDRENFDESSRYGRLVRLDTVAAPFADAHNGLSLIKVDTEGYDFSVLRSGATLIEHYRPALYFEWFPDLLVDLQEEVWSGFDFLEGLKYRHFVFFSSHGDYYCHLSRPDHFILKSLASTASQNKSLLYFDVFASTDEAVCKRLVELITTQRPN